MSGAESTEFIRLYDQGEHPLGHSEVIEVGADGSACIREYEVERDAEHWWIWQFQLSPDEVDKLLVPLRKTAPAEVRVQVPASAPAGWQMRTVLVTSAGRHDWRYAEASPTLWPLRLSLARLSRRVDVRPEAQPRVRRFRQTETGWWADEALQSCAPAAWADEMEPPSSELLERAYPAIDPRFR